METINEPSINIETANEPSITMAKTNEPYITMANTNEPYITMATANEPSITMANTNETSITMANTNEPYITMATTNEPYITTATTNEPYITMATANETSITMANTNEPPITVAATNAPSTSANLMSISSDETTNTTVQRKTVHDFNVFLSTFTSDEGTPFTNGYAMQTWRTLGKDNERTTKKLLAIIKEKGMPCSKSGLAYRLKLLQRAVFIGQKNITVEWSRITDMMNEMFRLPKKRSKPHHVDGIAFPSVNCNLQ